MTLAGALTDEIRMALAWRGKGARDGGSGRMATVKAMPDTQ